MGAQGQSPLGKQGGVGFQRLATCQLERLHGCRVGAAGGGVCKGGATLVTSQCNKKASSMSAQPNHDGHCGNFNGNGVDDDRLQIRARIGTTGVAATDLILPGAKIPVGQSNRPDINNCARPKLEHAKTLCKAKEHKFIPSMGCLIDTCFGGDGFAGQGR